MASEATYAGIIEIAADAIITLDAQQRITLFNHGAEQIFGYARDEMLGGELDRLLPERLRATHREHVRRFLCAGASSRRMGDRDIAIWGLRKSGEEFPAEAAISKFEVDGTSLLTVALRDVSDHKRIEDVLRLLADVGKTLVTAGPDYERLLTDVANLLVGRFADFCAVDLALGESIRRVEMVHVDPARAPVVQALARYTLERRPPALIVEAMASRRGVLVEEVSDAQLVATAQGPEHLALLRALDLGSTIVAPLIARDRVLGTIAVGRSRSSRRLRSQDVEVMERVATRIALAVDNARLHVALERAVRSRDEVLAIVAHDLRGPLNAIVLDAELVRRRKGLTADHARAFADAVVRIARGMELLIQDLVDVTRGEGPGLAIVCDRVSPAALLAEVVASQHHLVEDAQLQLHIEAAADLRDVWGDAARLGQVFGNLVGNAVKFTSAGGTITVRAQPAEGNVLFSVEDTGEGIEAEHLPHLFDRFWQAHPGRRRGAGLGLAITRSIIDAHHGELTVDSTRGIGTTFRFSVPLAPGVR